MQKVEIISPTISQTNQNFKLIKKNVAAYCRVSTDTEEQKTSYKSQITHYRDLISSNPEWHFAGIYADEGLSGTQVKKRNEFQRMIEDALNGKIDVIIAKSISRFARNTLDTLKYVRLLREHNIDVYFEKENIHTMDMDSEMFLTFYSAFAQAESESTSQNVILGNEMKMQRGDYVGLYAPYGFRYDEELKQLVIYEEEAKVVRYVFELYLQMGSCLVAKRLNSEGYKSPRGKKWRDSTVLDMITNEKYRGDLLTGKSYTVDPIEHIRKQNKGEKNKYYTKQRHVGIVSPEIFNRAQELRMIRSKGKTPENSISQTSNKYAFSSKITCGFCGLNYIRCSRKIGKDKHYYITWMCSSKKKTKTGLLEENCGNFNYREGTIEEAFVKAYSLLCKNKKKVIKELINKIQNILSSDTSEKELGKLQKQLNDLKIKQSSLVDMKLEGLIDQDVYMEKYKEITKKIDLFTARIDEYQNMVNDNKNILARIEHFKKIFSSSAIMKEFCREVFDIVVERIIIGKIEKDGTKNPNYIKFVLNTGTEIIDILPDKKNKKIDAILGDKNIAQNNVSFTSNKKWNAWCTSYISKIT